MDCTRTAQTIDGLGNPYWAGRLWVTEARLQSVGIARPARVSEHQDRVDDPAEDREFAPTKRILSVS
jgi:hypothetical protein